MKRVGLLVGRERTFPDALIAEVARRGAGVVCEYAKLSAPRAHEPVPYDVLVDRISHDIQCYQPWLKLAALWGTRVVNNPFWRIVDDKFFNAGLAARLGAAVPKTVLLPQKAYGPDVTSASLHNLDWVDWDELGRHLGYPMYMKPHWGGGWKDVSRVTSKEELLAAYDKSDGKTMIVQEEIVWTQYVRCIVIGQRDVMPALWDPRLPHHERYVKAEQNMPALDPPLLERVEKDALLITQALGYDMNTVEFAVRDGVPYAIDFMNSAPDFDVSSLGERHFAWVVSRMGELVIDLAKQRPQNRFRWDDLLRGR
jgi:glutathione synthase/RimK-type ligase-like ATP-grasp enzyme